MVEDHVQSLEGAEGTARSGRVDPRRGHAIGWIMGAGVASMPCNLEWRPAGGGVASTRQAGITVASVRPIGEVHGTSPHPAMPNLRLSCVRGKRLDRGWWVPVAKTWRCGEAKRRQAPALASGLMIAVGMNLCTCLMGGCPACARGGIDGKEYSMPGGGREGSTTVCRQRRIAPSFTTCTPPLFFCMISRR